MEGAKRKATQMRKFVLEEKRKRGVICVPEGSLLWLLVQIPGNASNRPGSSYTHRVVLQEYYGCSQSASQPVKGG